MMNIVKMEKKHLSEICELEKQCFSHPWSYQSLEAELYKNDAYFFVALKSDKVCGYIGMNTVLDEGYIANVAVLPQFQKQGIGQKLLEYLIKVSKEINLSFVTLEVRKSNEGAIALYSKNGFSVVGERKNFYSEPLENALLMTLYLNE